MSIDFSNPNVYNTLTEDQLEEWVEFIDWSMAPYRLLVDDIRKKFKDIPKLQVRLWFEETLRSLRVKVHKGKYSNTIVFSKGLSSLMDLDLDSGVLWCSYRKIWEPLENKKGRNYGETQSFIKNILEMYLYELETISGYKVESLLYDANRNTKLEIKPHSTEAY